MTTKIYSNIDKTKILHMFNRFEDILGRTNVCPDNQFLQLATLRMNEGDTFRPHKHIYKKAPEITIAQESWIVIRGSVKVFFYDIDDSIIETCILKSGDCSITFEGGHNYLILEDDTVVYEFKTGPYTGLQNDKRFI